MRAPDDLAHRCGRELDEGWGKKHAVGQRALRLKKHINDFDLMSVWQGLAAKRVEVANRRRRVCRVARDVKSEFEIGLAHGRLLHLLALAIFATQFTQLVPASCLLLLALLVEVTQQFPQGYRI